MKSQDVAIEFAKKINEAGGHAYYVGGYVRDYLLGKSNKDIDIEVHGLSQDKLEAILGSFGPYDIIGSRYGIYTNREYDIDVALPRKEVKTGEGHTSFDIVMDPYMGCEEAIKRRDFTIDALMMDVLTNEIIDNCNGLNDLKHKIIRHVNSESFKEDPLRVLRAAQFASRFEFSIDEETLSYCKGMDLSTLTRDRVFAEMKKALLQADKPSIFFNVLRDMDHLEWFKEVKDLIGVRQSPIYHSEGDVYTHSLLVLDKGVEYRNKVQDPLGFMLACLCHDFGKIICTEEIDGVIHAYHHEVEGLPLVESFITRLTSDKHLLKYVLNLCEMHMKPNAIAYANASIKSSNHMFDKALDRIALICLADADGKGTLSAHPFVSYDNYLYERLHLYEDIMSKPYITGKDLIDAGLKPDDSFRELLAYAHKLRMSGLPKELALKQVLGMAKHSN